MALSPLLSALAGRGQVMFSQVARTRHWKESSELLPPLPGYNP